MAAYCRVCEYITCWLTACYQHQLRLHRKRVLHFTFCLHPRGTYPTASPLDYVYEKTTDTELKHTTRQFDLDDVRSKFQFRDGVEALAEMRLDSERVPRLSQDLQQFVVGQEVKSTMKQEKS